VDCFFHHAVPSVAQCAGCRKPICPTCRNESGICPSCVLAARIDAARESSMINGGVGPSSSGASYSAPPHPEPAPHYGPPPRGTVQTSTALAVRPETRALVALSYPFWPLALIALLDAKGSHFVRRQAWQALGFNLGMWGFGALLGAIASLPIIGFGAWPLLPFIAPVWLVASVVYAFRVFQGDDVNVPVVSDWVDARLPSDSVTS
jgi:uncharacterized membrane protein